MTPDPKSPATASIDAEQPFRVARLVGRLRLAIIHRADRVLERWDLTTQQWSVLVYLAESLAQTPAEIATLLAIDRGATSRLVDRLERKNLVRRVAHDTDRRSVRLELSEEAKRLYPSIRPDIGAALTDMMSPLEPGELVRLEELLLRLHRATVQRGTPGVGD